MTSPLPRLPTKHCYEVCLFALWLLTTGCSFRFSQLFWARNRTRFVVRSFSIPPMLASRSGCRSLVGLFLVCLSTRLFLCCALVQSSDRVELIKKLTHELKSLREKSNVLDFQDAFGFVASTVALF